MCVCVCVCVCVCMCVPVCVCVCACLCVQVVIIDVCGNTSATTAPSCNGKVDPPGCKKYKPAFCTNAIISSIVKEMCPVKCGLCAPGSGPTISSSTTTTTTTTTAAAAAAKGGILQTKGLELVARESRPVINVTGNKYTVDWRTLRKHTVHQTGVWAFVGSWVR